MKRLLIILAVAWCGYVQVAMAASFDCGKAQTRVEKIICTDEKLSKQDNELARAYAGALAQGNPALKAEQKGWLKERDRCQDAECIRRFYDHRLKALAGVNSENAATMPAATTEAACLPPKIDWHNYQWMLITGNGMTACEEMLAYLKSRPKDAPPPVCPEERLPPNGNWTRPESRILNEAEKQALIRDIPDKWRQKPNGPVSYERMFKETELMRVIRADITRDGIPEMLLAYSQHDYRKTCGRAAQCASEIDPIVHSVFKHYPFKYAISLHGGHSDNYDLLPMNDAGTQVDWQHRVVGEVPMLRDGELVYYKGRPYWLSFVEWNQLLDNDFTHSTLRADDPNSAIFKLYPIAFTQVGQRGGPIRPAHFSNVEYLTGDIHGAVCHFGYFHRDNLKLNPPSKRR